MKINGSIYVTDDDNKILCAISGDDVICHEGFNVHICEDNDTPHIKDINGQIYFFE